MTAWRSSAPWADDAQVEQDLALSRAAVELFADNDLAGKIALRGGTSLHKLFVQPPNPWFTGECKIATFEIDELLATKLRALYQRRKGRDLFDLWLCIEQRLIDPQRLVDCFGEYMDREGHPLTRAQFEQNLHEKESDPAFLSDIGALLRPGLAYDAGVAIGIVKKALIELLPGEPWRGSPGEGAP